MQQSNAVLETLLQWLQSLQKIQMTFDINITSAETNKTILATANWHLTLSVESKVMGHKHKSMILMCTPYTTHVVISWKILVGLKQCLVYNSKQASHSFSIYQVYWSATLRWHIKHFKICDWILENHPYGHMWNI